MNGATLDLADVLAILAVGTMSLGMWIEQRCSRAPGDRAHTLRGASDRRAREQLDRG